MKKISALLLGLVLLASSIKADSFYDCISNTAFTALTQSASYVDITVQTGISQATLVNMSCTGPNTVGFYYAWQDLRRSTAAPCASCYSGYCAVSTTSQAWPNMDPHMRLWVIAPISGSSSCTVSLGLCPVEVQTNP